MSGALCGLAVGLGALFPNFKEDNPSKIVSGFGGTLCLVASFFTSCCSSRCWRFRRACRSPGRRCRASETRRASCRRRRAARGRWPERGGDRSLPLDAARDGGLKNMEF